VVNDKIAVYVKHPLASLADAYSTALFVAPLDIAIAMIEANKNLEALMILQDGEIYKSQ
jgi:thiamine biosynthesis lipoprotein ApbE